MPTEELRVEIRLRDFATRQLKRVAGSIGRFAATARRRFASISKAIFSLRGALVGLGAGLIAKSFIDAGSAMEKFRVQLTAVLDGQRELADETLQWVRDFGAVTPFTTESVIQAFVQLKSVGINATQDMLTVIGDTAFAMNRSIEDVANALVSGETEVLRRLGIEMKRTGETATLVSGDMRVQTVNDMGEIRKSVIDVWAKRFPGAMKEAENTWEGMISLLKSEWFEFQVAVMEGGVFMALKEGIKEASLAFKDLSKDPQATADIIIDVLEGIAVAISAVRDAITVLRIAFVGLGVIARGVLAGIQKAAEKVTQAIAGVFERAAEMFQSMAEDGGLVRDAIEGITGVSMEKMGQKMQELARTFDSFSVSAEEAFESNKEELKLMLDEIERLRDLGKTEEMLQLFERIRARIEAARIEAQKAKQDLQVMVDATGQIMPPEFDEGMIKPVEGLVKVLKQQNEELVEANRQAERLEKNFERLEPAALDAHDIIMGMSMAMGGLVGNLIAATAAADKFAKDLKEKQAQKLLEAMRDTAREIASVVGSTLVRVFDDWVEGQLKPAREIVRGLLQDIARALVQKAVTGAITTVFGAKGGVFPTQTNFQAFARGGVTDGPTLAMFGEGRNREAVVPLPDNRNIPVKLIGGDGASTPRNVTFNINTIDAQGVEQFLFNNRQKIQRMTGISQMEGRTGRKSI